MASQINLSGAWSDQTALLATGAMQLTGLDALAGRTQFNSSTQMQRIPPSPPPPYVPGPCDNQLVNGGVEQTISPTRNPRGRSNLGVPDATTCLPTAVTGDVAAWQTASLASPDWFRRGAPSVPLDVSQPTGLQTSLDIPMNDMTVNGSETRSAPDSSYLGLYSNDAPGRQFREYAFQTLPAPWWPAGATSSDFILAWPTTARAASRSSARASTTRTRIRPG